MISDLEAIRLRSAILNRDVPLNLAVAGFDAHLDLRERGAIQHVPDRILPIDDHAALRLIQI